MKVGIVGLPNVGKSTLFNAFLKQQANPPRREALSANYPFATIDPNIGVVDVYDERVDKLAKLSCSEKKVYASVEFVDIAGIVEGAHKGEGLGNQFLAHIREVDLILILLRDFEDESIIREGSKNPDYDYNVILTELILKDLETVHLQERKTKKVSNNKKENDFVQAILKVKESLDNQVPASKADLTADELEQIKKLHLLTLKPMIRLFNVDEKMVVDRMNRLSNNELVVSAKIESELASLDEADRKAYLRDLGWRESPLKKVIQVCYRKLGLETFLTTGPKESRAWKFVKGMNAGECAGIIHTDFEKNFIKAEVVKYEDFLRYLGRLGAKEAGKLRLEGKNYPMQDGDVVEFKIGVQ